MHVGAGIIAVVVAYLLGLFLWVLIRQERQRRVTNVRPAGLTAWQGLRRGALCGLLLQLLVAAISAAAWVQAPGHARYEVVPLAGLLSLWAGAPLSLAVTALGAAVLPRDAYVGPLFLAVLVPFFGILNWGMCGALVGAIRQRAGRTSPTPDRVT